jgi:hypothetical protein
MVRESTPRASRAAVLLPAKRSALTATARVIGMPFQCVISTPGANGGADMPAASRVTMNFSSVPSLYRSTWKGR